MTKPAPPVEPDAIERHPFNYRWRERLHDVAIINAWEGGALYSAQGEGAYWLIFNEGTMADFLPKDDPLLSRLIRLERYDTVEKWHLAIDHIVREVKARIAEHHPWTTYEEKFEMWQKLEKMIHPPK